MGGKKGIRGRKIKVKKKISAMLSEKTADPIMKRKTQQRSRKRKGWRIEEQSIIWGGKVGGKKKEGQE